MADYHPQGTAERGDRQSRSLSNKEVGLSRSFGPRGRLLMWHTSRGLWRYFRKQRPVATIFALSLCLIPACWYLPERNLYPCLASQFYGSCLRDTSRSGPHGQWGLCPQGPQDHNRWGKSSYLAIIPRAQQRGSRQRCSVFLERGLSACLHSCGLRGSF